MQPVDDFPGVPADRHDLFGRAWAGSLSLADGGIAHLRIELVGGFRGDAGDHAVADPDAGFAADIADQPDGVLMIGRGSR
jgi:hypothetical protein